MKKITQLFILLTVSFAFNLNAQDNCGSALPVTSGVTNTTTINSDGMLDSEMSVGAGGVDSAWYTFTAPSDGIIDVSSCNGGADTVLYIGTGTCGSLTSIANEDDTCDEGGGNGYASEITGLAVTNGTTYYIEWADVWEDGPFDWTLTFTPPAACEVPTDLSIDFLTDVQVDFSWSAPTVGGTPVDYNWEIQLAADPQGTATTLPNGASATTSASSGAALTLATDYVVFVQTNCGGAGNSSYISLAFTTNAVPPPSNDLACSATSIGVNDAAATYTNAGASVEANEPFGDCWFFEADDLNESVWFTFTTPIADDVTVSLDFAGGTLADTVLALYTGGDCSDLSTLVQVECDDDGGAGGLSSMTVTSLPAGTYFVQVDGILQDEGTFDLQITAPNVLSTETFEDNTSFSYYPNPVENTLNFNAQKNIQNVSLYNMLGQEVLKAVPNALTSELDTSSLGSGTYVAAVTIENVTKTIRIIKR